MPNTQSSAQKGRHLVLLVDDAPDELRMLWRTLDDAGYHVLVATNGQAALERLDYVTPDIVLLDAVMPGMDGFETCQRLKAHPRATHTPVVFMTGLTETQHVVRGFQAGGVDYVTKPLDTDVVLARLRAHLRSHQWMTAALDAIDAIQTAVVVLDSTGHPLWKTPRARQWLHTYFGWNVDRPDLPPALNDWVHQTLAQTPNEPMVPFVQAGAQGQLVMRLKRRSQGAASEELTLLMEEQSLPLDPQRRLAERYRLTARETEVLLWVAKGKTNRDIADILGMAPRTVNKHLEHIFVKLGVETRAAATALTLQHALRAPDM